jgi:hypothetical protein
VGKEVGHKKKEGVGARGTQAEAQRKRSGPGSSGASGPSRLLLQIPERVAATQITLKMPQGRD